MVSGVAGRTGFGNRSGLLLFSRCARAPTLRFGLFFVLFCFFFRFDFGKPIQAVGKSSVLINAQKTGRVQLLNNIRDGHQGLPLLSR